MNKSSLISIIMPVYNSSLYLQYAIDSIINQTYDNWELLIIDDNSTDNTPDIIHTYLYDKRIRVFKNNINLGPAKSRNIGLEHANGDYITFLDSDDLLGKDKLKRQIDFMKKNNIPMSHGNFYFINENKKLNILKKIIVNKKISYRNLLKGNEFKIMTVMLSKNIVSNYRFENIKHEDYAYFLECLKRSDYSYSFNEKEIDSFCRIREKSVSSNKLRSAIWTFNIYYNHQHLGLFRSIYYFIWYAIKGILKYR